MGKRSEVRQYAGSGVNRDEVGERLPLEAKTLRPGDAEDRNGLRGESGVGHGILLEMEWGLTRSRQPSSLYLRNP
ncbi:hypothetical protein JOD63_002077 [Microbacterium terrae]|uniref:Uncharacterized protein n=1 Tax=Microbacterium terrae TaxID=69369 RepID=A0A0M2H6H7_9MICO|nr:hypothetical protein RS81_01934 [Microbacterium terrae]MBP1078109.1 hypothetical protein [Microbacterium terrae]GLK00278.1 hypothetical protein GCM10017594_34750 [Microbacterium terrae]